MSLTGKKVLLGLTGGIACYKIPYLIRALGKASAEVRVIMTEGAIKFITPLTLETVSGNPVGRTMFPDGEYVATRHIDLVDWADLLVIAPATANFLGKTAGGICDDLLTTIVCACRKTILVAPAMNPGMWANPVTQKNITFLRELGYCFVGPNEGDMACNHVGLGRMAEPDEIFKAVFSLLEPQKKKLSSKKILVTAGPTREAVDPVRYLTNRSSGKMGFAIARTAVEMGAEVTLVSGPVGLERPVGVKFLPVESTEQMHRAVKEEFNKCHCLVMAAAPADYRPVVEATGKIKRSSDGHKLALEPTADILKDIAGDKKNDQVVVGFALETDNDLENARRKLKQKSLDLILLNRVGSSTGFDHDTNQVTLIRPEGEPEVWPLLDKSKIAINLLELVAKML